MTAPGNAFILAAIVAAIRPGDAQLALMGLALLVHLVLDRHRWQMWPAYLAAGLLLPFSHATLWPMVVQVSLLVLSAALSHLLPVFRLPAPAGPSRVAHVTLVLTDTTRPSWSLYDGYTPPDQSPGATNDRSQYLVAPRRLVVRVWYPTSADIARRHQPAEYLPFMQERARFFADMLRLPRFAVGHFRRVVTNVFTGDGGMTVPPFTTSTSGSSACPVVLFSHGYDSSSDLSSILFHHLVSHDRVVVAVEHTCDSMATCFPDTRQVVHFDAGLPESLMALDQPAVADEFWRFRRRHLDIRVRDLEFVLTQLEEMNNNNNSDGSTGPFASLFHGRLDLHNITAMGHSFGGATAVAAAARDSRIHAVVGLDAWLTPVEDQIKQQGIAVPVLLVQAEKFMAARTMFGRHNDEDCAALVAHSAAGSRLLRCRNATHQDFLDFALFAPRITKLLGYSGLVGAEAMQLLLGRVCSAFLDATPDDKALLDHPADIHPALYSE